MATPLKSVNNATGLPRSLQDQPTGWWALGICRIVVGYLWLQQTFWKLPPDFGAPRGLLDWMQREAAHPLVPVFGSFVKNVAIPHFHLFGWLTWGTETLIALSLLLGLFARLGGLVGTFWALNLTIGLWQVPGEWYWTYLMLLMLNAILFGTASGRYIGLDGLLRTQLLPSLRGTGARVLSLIS